MKSRVIKIVAIIILGIIAIALLSPISRAENESFTLTANKTTVDVNEIIDVELNLNNGLQNQNQLTVIVRYDSEKLEIIPDKKYTDDSEILVENESLYNDIITAEDGIILGFVNEDSTASLVYYTNSKESYLKTSTKLAKLKFKAIGCGSAKISFDTIEYAYESDDPTDIKSNSEITINIKDNQELPNEHSHTWNAGIVTKVATCTATGVKTYTCLECGENKTETIAKIAHNYKTTTTTAKTTLSKDGKIITTKKCTVCGNIASTNTTTIAYPKTVKLKTTSYTYDKKAKKPVVVVTDSNGKTIASSNYTVKYSSNKKVGTATATITFKGNYEGTKKLTFKINPKGVSLKKLTKGRKQFKATWGKNTTQTTGYEIQYSTNKKFKSGNKKVTIKKNKTTSSTVKKLKSKKKYYVRIRTYKTVNGKKYYSGWSKVLNVKTK